MIIIIKIGAAAYGSPIFINIFIGNTKERILSGHTAALQII